MSHLTPLLMASGREEFGDSLGPREFFLFSWPMDGGDAPAAGQTAG